MILFLTSSPTGDLDGKYTCEGFDTRNGFRDRLSEVWKENARCLMITAFPSDFAASDEMTGFFHDAVLKTGLSVSSFDLWDDRTFPPEYAVWNGGDQDGEGRGSGDQVGEGRGSGDQGGMIPADDALACYDVIFLGGGHVPTQNAFFHRIGLREKLAHFDGIIIGISAGSMNAADEVYAQPEMPGEAADPSYRRFLRGLGLTDINILPHYQIVRDNMLDGRRLFEDITIPDCEGRRALILPDGSFLMIKDGEEQVFGEGYWIGEGKLWPAE